MSHAESLRPLRENASFIAVMVGIVLAGVALVIATVSFFV